MDVKNIKALVDVLKDTSFDEFSYESKEFKISLKRNQTSSVVAHSDPHHHHAYHVNHTPPPQAAPAAPAEEKPKVEADLHYVTSPLVGTFYISPSPESSPFVAVGTYVKKGDTIGIIEAMKLMNEIESDVDGEVVAIVSENANPVEFGTKLVAIKKK